MQIYTINVAKKKNIKGRAPNESAWLIKDNFKKLSKFEHINKIISVLKLKVNTLDHVGLALIGTYLSSNNNKNDEYTLDLELIANTYTRLIRERFKVIIIGDLNGDSKRLKYKQDLLSTFIKKENLLELPRI